MTPSARDRRHRISRWHSITTKQAVLTFLVALAVSVVAGTIELVEEARITRGEVRQQTERLLEIAGGTAAEAAFQLNTELAAHVVHGFFVGNDVERVVLRDDFGRIMASEERLPEVPAGPFVNWLFGDITDYQRTLRYNLAGSAAGQPVGVLELSLSLPAIGDAFMARSALIFGLGMIKALAIALVVVIGFHWLITRPLLQVFNAITAVDPKQPGQWPKPRLRSHSRDELGMLVRALHDLLSAFQIGLNQRDELHQISTIDGLTGIANRRHFDDIYQREWRECRRAKTPVALIFIDIDDFKRFNDNYGHALGDDCLREVSRALKAALPRSTDLAARYGGEEFICVLPHTDDAGALEVGNRIRNAIQALSIPHQYSGAADCVTVSIGIATMFPGDTGTSPDALLALADRRLYRAKELGRNRVVNSGE